VADRSGRVGEGRLTARIVGERVKKIAQRSGLDPQSFASHSLRSGFATSAASAKKSDAAIMRQDAERAAPSREDTSQAGCRWHDHARRRNRARNAS